MSRPAWFSRIMIALVAFTLCGGPQLLAAQQTTPAPEAQAPDQQPIPATSDSQAQPVPQQDQTNIGTTPESATPDPSKGVQQPSGSNLPNAPSSTQQPTQTPANSKDQQKTESPLGAAAAQAGKTTGGAASKPAGTAIAPAKQRQTRSLLIKVGAIAAGAAAAGIIYGLSRSSPSVPPGARTTAGVQAAH